MTCPYCKRNEGHYLGCQTLDHKPGMFESWWQLARVVAISLGVWALLWLVVRLIAGD